MNRERLWELVRMHSLYARGVPTRLRRRDIGSNEKRVRWGRYERTWRRSSLGRRTCRSSAMVEEEEEEKEEEEEDGTMEVLENIVVCMYVCMCVCVCVKKGDLLGEGEDK